VIIVGGSLAWVYAHNQQPLIAGPHPSTPTPTPSPTVFNLVINAAQDSPGLDTGIDVTAGSTLTITAQGTAAYGSGYSTCPEVTNPDGSIVSSGGTCSPNIDPNATLPTSPVGELLGSIGQPGTSSSTGWFAVGSNYSQQASSSGRLFLIYNDDPGQYGNNSGSYQVMFTVAGS
jgi:PA-IL-like protein